MPRATPVDDELNRIELPVLTGPTLAPRLYGPDDYSRVLSQVVQALPNLEALRARRLLEPGPVPVRFRCTE